MKLIILAGGSGSRLRPLSQASIPKQFISLDGQMTMLDKTIQRILPLLSSPEDIIISTSIQYLGQIKSYADRYGIVHVIAEPSRRNTAPAIALVLRYLKDYGIDDQEALYFLPADAEIAPDDLFRQYIHSAQDVILQDYIVLFGIKPNKPETGYGYIKIAENYRGGILAKIDCFTEKPSLDAAIQYVQSGQYFWNSGIFGGNIQTFRNGFATYMPELFDLMQTDTGDMVSRYDLCPDLSIDYGIMEHLADQSMVIPMFVNWSDMGSRDAVYEFFPKDTNGNVIRGQRDIYDVTNCLLINTTDRPAKTNNITHSIVVQSPQGLYIAQLGHSQSIKKLIS